MEILTIFQCKSVVDNGKTKTIQLSSSLETPAIFIDLCGIESTGKLEIVFDNKSRESDAFIPGHYYSIKIARITKLEESEEN